MNRTYMSLGSALLVALAATLSTAQEPPAKEGTAVERKATWSVMEFGAVADGTTDNTAAFQKALAAASAAGGGVVEAPAGKFGFDGSLVFPKDVTLRGVFAYAPAHAGIRDKRDDEMPVYGTVLLPRGGAGSEEGAPFIQLDSNSVLQGVCVHYPDQKPDAEAPTPYPYTVVMRGNNSAIVDVELLNPYNAIDASQNQRVLIRNVHGQPIHIGLYIDHIYDIGRVENVHWNPWWSLNTPVFKWQMEHGIAFIFGKSDWHYVLNTFCFGYHIGYQFIETKSGVTNGNFLGIGADNCQTAVSIENSSPIGILITNGEFVSFDGPDPTMVRVEKTNSGAVRFSNCAFWGPCNRIALIAGTGVIGFSDCTFQQWGYREKPVPAITAVGGTVLIRGCEFHEDKPQVLLGEGVKRAIVTENVVEGAVRIGNNSKGKTVVEQNIGTE
ncbi:MAG: glycosyl hydrolase family 28-related protein [Candidatus Hydrogenedentales bacterium]